MQVEIVDQVLTKNTRFGEAKSVFGLQKVMVNGVQGGWTPRDPKDENYGVFHPLSGFPQELVAEVEAACPQLCRKSLRAPKPQPQKESA